ncbi:hypothetical protein BH11PAT1_BH11PAT1_7960 [soil metagenome]
MSKYSKKAQDTVAQAMHEFKAGKLKSNKQAVAIGLSEARESGANVFTSIHSLLTDAT